MFQSTAKVRVRYAETDQMGYCYYGNYAQYYEVARVEGLRKLGISYKDLEAQGYLLPVSEFHIKYILPAYYDEELLVKCTIYELPKIKIKFNYEIHNINGDLLNFGSTTLVFVDKQTKKPVNCPDFLKNKLSKIIHEK
jgi:acyl-CoA thioester hydrolase|tara:strand:+ start:1774 stop:2187 length:414 start_codon:yes stop_codon:yes gene_type:complete